MPGSTFGTASDPSVLDSNGSKNPRTVTTRSRIKSWKLKTGTEPITCYLVYESLILISPEPPCPQLTRDSPHPATPSLGFSRTATARNTLSPFTLKHYHSFSHHQTQPNHRSPQPPDRSWNFHYFGCWLPPPVIWFFLSVLLHSVSASFDMCVFLSRSQYVTHVWVSPPPSVSNRRSVRRYWVSSTVGTASPRVSFLTGWHLQV